MNWYKSYKIAMSMDVHHGSPHQFSQFSTDYMGSGEGEQAYGWGTYFTDKPEAAKYYATSFSGIKGDNSMISLGPDDTKFIGELIQIYNGDAKKITNILRKINDFCYTSKPKELREKLKKIVPQQLWYANIIDGDKGRVNYLIEKLQNKTKLEYRPEQYLYDVKLFPDRRPSQYRLINWDIKASDELKKKIVDELKTDSWETTRIIQDENGMPKQETFKQSIWDKDIKTNGHLYNWIKHCLWGNSMDSIYENAPNQEHSKKASQLLLKLGIDGIKYQSGFQNKQYSYVLFDPSQAKITQTQKLN